MLACLLLRSFHICLALWLSWRLTKRFDFSFYAIDCREHPAWSNYVKRLSPFAENKKFPDLFDLRDSCKWFLRTLKIKWYDAVHNDKVKHSLQRAFSLSLCNCQCPLLPSINILPITGNIEKKKGFNVLRFVSLSLTIRYCDPVFTLNWQKWLDSWWTFKNFLASNQMFLSSARLWS